MNCYVCSGAGRTEPAIATCRHCNAGLCLTHLREEATHQQTGAIRTGCSHDTWSRKK